MTKFLAVFLLAILTQVHPTGESWLLGPPPVLVVKADPSEGKIHLDVYHGDSSMRIVPVRAEGTSPADAHDPVVLSIMLPASPGVGRSVEAVRMTGGCGVPGCLVYHGGAVQIDQARIRTADWQSGAYTDDHLQTLQAGEGRIHWESVELGQSFGIYPCRGATP